MSDFDTALERLLTDPAFAAALAADPDAALSGYRLAPDEAAVLRSQLTGDLGGQSQVEDRTTKSSAFGLLAPLGALLDLPLPGPGSAGLGDPGHGPGDAAVVGCGPAPLAPSTRGSGSGSMPDMGVSGMGAGPASGFGGGGAADFPARSGFGAAGPARTGMGAADVPAYAAAAAEIVTSAARATIAAAEAAALDPVPAPGEMTGGPPPPDGYRNRVDADGDGSWDRHSLRGRADGGVDILVDLNRDGRADFIGHDDDADGRVDSAHYDKDHDGWFERQMFDDTGDGWLDRSVRRPPPAGS